MPMPSAIIHKVFDSSVSITEDDSRAITAAISTSAVDRAGDVLVPQGCISKDYEANPLLCWQHGWDGPPIGKCLGIKRTATQVFAKFQFAERPASHPDGDEWIPDTLLALYQQKVMRAFSVGFISVESRPANDKDILRFGADCRRVHSKWKLLEVSCVTIPCNQEAVAIAVSKGLLRRDHAAEWFHFTAPADPEPPISERQIDTTPRVSHVHRIPAPEPVAAIVARSVRDAIDKARGAVYVHD